MIITLAFFCNSKRESEDPIPDEPPVMITDSLRHSIISLVCLFKHTYTLDIPMIVHKILTTGKEIT
jgi:hypothetical protein